MGRRSEVCSALAGGIMGLGLRFGRDFADNRDDGRRPYWYSTDFIENFRARHGRVCCRDLLGLDLFCTGGYPEVPGGEAVGIHCKDLIAAMA